MSTESGSSGAARRRVVITGAAGYVAGLMLPGLRPRYDLTLLTCAAKIGRATPWQAWRPRI